MQGENDDKQQQIHPHAGLEDQVQDKMSGLEDLRCEEQDLQTSLREGEQVEIDGDYLNNIQIYIRKQLPPLSVTGVDANVRAQIIDEMIRSTISGFVPPLAVHLAVQLLDQYFASNSQAVKALNPHTVASSALSIAMKRGLNPTDLVGGAQNRNEFEILNHIGYGLNAPTRKMLVDAVIDSTEPHPLTLVCLWNYFTDLSLLEKDCSNFKISDLTAAIIFIGLFLFQSYQSPQLELPWEWDTQRLREAVTILHQLHLGSRLPTCRSVKTKFSPSSRCSVATLTCPLVIPDSYFC
ncbi:unnamed protein product [Microthlaspi erraticum]|uniref:Cyclin C-terminal domain-containing protein n=1 Tax=Microthlaspi erraticum TaxID=1685480 RepID=A0A6D2HZA8_9BRAS|nr:unnamed protein product [Microthlaspi erraticum]